MDVARAEPQGARYHADVIYLRPSTGNYEGSMDFMLL